MTYHTDRNEQLNRIFLAPQLLTLVESYYGVSLRCIDIFTDCSLPAGGIKAYARGKEIHIAENIFAHETPECVAVIGHEFAHILQQASANATGNTLLYDEFLEACADVHGKKLAALAFSEKAVRADYINSASNAFRLTLCPAQTDISPIQAWGIGGLGAYIKQIISGAVGNNYFELSGGEHECLTRHAISKTVEAFPPTSQQRKVLTNKSITDYIIKGSQFNDIYLYNVATFTALYKSKIDSFINESHSGSMQFLHSMDCSSGNYKDNHAKILRWARFCLDVYRNPEAFGEQKIGNYISALPQNDILSQMLRPALFENNMVTEYGEKTIYGFFNDNSNKKDKNIMAKYIAIGSVAHMIEDSFAGSHSCRAYNMFLGKTVNTEIEKDMKLPIKNFKILQKIPPVLVFADFTKQATGRHALADYIREDPDWDGSVDIVSDEKSPQDKTNEDRSFKMAEHFIDFTQGGALARDCVAQFLYFALSGRSTDDIIVFLEFVFNYSAEVSSMPPTVAGRAFENKISDMYGISNKSFVFKYYTKYEENILRYNAPNIIFRTRREFLVITQNQIELLLEQKRLINLLLPVLNIRNKCLPLYDNLKEKQETLKKLYKDLYNAAEEAQDAFKDFGDKTSDKTKEALEKANLNVVTAWRDMLFGYRIVYYNIEFNLQTIIRFFDTILSSETVNIDDFRDDVNDFKAEVIKALDMLRNHGKLFTSLNNEPLNFNLPTLSEQLDICTIADIPNITQSISVSEAAPDGMGLKTYETAKKDSNQAEELYDILYYQALDSKVIDIYDDIIGFIDDTFEYLHKSDIIIERMNQHCNEIILNVNNINHQINAYDHKVFVNENLNDIVNIILKLHQLKIMYDNA